MSKITTEILKAIAPSTPKAKRDRFLPDMNKLLPHFEINNKLRVAAFLATCCLESDYFKATSEYGKGKGRPYAKVYADTGYAYYGRGIIQNTWRDAYENFTAYVKRNWSWLKEMAGVESAPDFVADPDLLTEPFWAVLAACWFWHRNKLNARADGGLKNFFGIQGIVNRGSADKKALHYADRLAIYETLRRTLPDNFNLVLPAESPAEPKPATIQPETSETRVDGAASPGSSSSESSQSATEETISAEKKTEQGVIKSEQTVLNQQNVNEDAPVNEPKPQGFTAKLFAGLVSLLGGTLLYDSLGKFSGIQFSAQSIYIICFVIFLTFLGFCVWAVLDAWKSNERTRNEVLANTDITRKNIVWVKPEVKEGLLTKAKNYLFGTKFITPLSNGNSNNGETNEK